MAYTHSKYEVLMTATAVSATATGDKATWEPGFMPHIVRAVSVIPTVSGNPLTGCVFDFNHLDLASGSTASTLAVINGASTHVVGTAAYKIVTGEVVVKPGQRVVFNVDTAASGVNCKAVLYVEPKWDDPSNSTDLIAST